MASPKNAKVSGYADVVINSLTKYANWEGDVMMGSAVFLKNPHLAWKLKKLPLNTPPNLSTEISKEWRSRSFL